MSSIDGLGIRVIVAAIIGSGAVFIDFGGADPSAVMLGIACVYMAMYIEYKTNLIGDTLSRIDFSAGKRRRSADAARTQSIGQQGSMMRKPQPSLNEENDES